MSKVNESMSLANPAPPFLDAQQKIASAIGAIGLLILFLASFNVSSVSTSTFLSVSLLLMSVGVVWYSARAYLTKKPGIKNDGVWFSSISSRGVIAWIAGIIITGFYVLLYWYPSLLGLGQDGAANMGLVGFFDPLSQFIKGKPASQWFVYGTLYTIAILIFGLKFIWKYRHNKYQVLRTLSVMFFQTAFAFLIPEILEGLNEPLGAAWFGTDAKNMWPLDYDFFHAWHLDNLRNGGSLGMFMLIWGLLLILVISPLLTYFYGKRWYCSWVCGCGGLAETAGDPFRQLSDKSLRAWKVERWMIHSVLVFVFVMTALVLFQYFTDQSSFLGIPIYPVQKWYGFFIGAAFSGVVGVGFYPIMGSRVWCRFGCPMAALLGIQQKFFSRFRITTNGGQCISCGNCSTYCEMGIDVRAYAQKGQNIVRASCVGCGICAAVCPRGVLRLEGGSADISSKTDQLRTIHITEDQVQVFS